MPEKDEQPARLLPFVLSFTVTLLLMAGVLSSTLLLHQRQQATQSAAKPYQGPATVFLPEPDDRLVMLVAAGETADTPPDCYLLAGFLPDKGCIALCLLPPKTLLQAGEQWGTLEEQYLLGGLPYAAKQLSSYLGVPVEHTALFTLEGVRRLVEDAGFFEYYLPVELDYPLHQRQVAMSQGKQLLDGRKLMDILCYPAYKGGEKERSDRGAMLLTELVNAHLPDCDTAQGDVLVKSFLNNSKNDLSMFEYEERRQATRFLATLELPAATAVYVEGSLNRDYTSFVLTESCRARLSSVFGGDGFTLQGDRAGTVEAGQDITDEPKPPAE